MGKQITIYVVRHGQTEYNKLGIIGGTYEPNRLSKTGEDQAQILGEQLKNIHFNKIFSSSLSRARKTAEIISELINVSVEVDELLNERYWGVLQGKSFAEAQQMIPEVFLLEAKIEGKDALRFKYVPDMESLEETVARFNEFLDKVKEKYKGNTLLVVSHFDIMIGYLFSIGLGSYQQLMNAKFDHTGYYKLIINNNKVQVAEIKGLHLPIK